MQYENLYGGVNLGSLLNGTLKTTIFLEVLTVFLLVVFSFHATSLNAQIPAIVSCHRRRLTKWYEHEPHFVLHFLI